MHASTRSRSLRRFIPILIIVATFVLIQQTFNDSDVRLLEEQNTQVVVEVEVSEVSTNSTTTKPVMMTFFEPVWGGCCGMTEEGHQELLKAWKDSWEAKGWDTKVLTEKDAKLHPDFDMLETKLKDLGVKDYDRRCYWRWLAMATNHDGNGGGGWMSDYDVFPMALSAEKAKRFEKNGKLKSFALHVPCLIHASREEWDKVIHLMIEALPEKRNGLISDMMSLMDVHDRLQAETGMIFMNRVTLFYPYVTTKDGDVRLIFCWDIERYEAVHISHFATSESIERKQFPQIEGIGNDKRKALQFRWKVARRIMEDIHEKCFQKVE